MRNILHISDVHFGPFHLPEVAQAVLDLTRRREPDLVVISGDLTQRAKPHQFAAARAFVDRVTVPVIAVPGNHDVPLYRFWERFVTPYGAYRKHFDAELEPVFRDEELLVAGVNTAHGWTFIGGRFRNRRLEEVETLLAAEPQGRCKIVVAHHGLIPPPHLSHRRVSRNSAAAVDLFSGSGVELILSGHDHQAYAGDSHELYPSGRAPVLILHSGTTTSSRGRGSEVGHNTCHWIRVDDDEILVSRLWYDCGSFETRGRDRYPRSAAAPDALNVEDERPAGVVPPVVAGEPG